MTVEEEQDALCNDVLALVRDGRARLGINAVVRVQEPVDDRIFKAIDALDYWGVVHLIHEGINPHARVNNETALEHARAVGAVVRPEGCTLDRITKRLENWEVAYDSAHRAAAGRRFRLF